MSINFYDDAYVSPAPPTRYTGAQTDGLWIYESKVKMYTNDLKLLNESLIVNLKSSQVAYNNKADPVNNVYYSNIEAWISRQEDKFSLELLFDSGRGLFTEKDTGCVEGSFDCLLRLILRRTKPSAGAINVPSQERVFSEKVVEFHNKFFGNFSSYYMMARQLNNFNCQYLPTFKRLFTFTTGMIDGTIFGYFDSKTQDLYDGIQLVIANIRTHYLNINLLDWTNADKKGRDGNGDIIIDVTLDEYYHEIYLLYTTEYNTVVAPYKALIVQGTVEMETILVSGEGFLESLFSGIKVISTSNIALTADSSDDPMLQYQAQNSLGVTHATDPNLTNETRNRMFDDIKVSATVTQIALKLKLELKPDFSNFEHIMSLCVTLGLKQTGTLSYLEDMTTVLGIYERN